MGLRYATVTGVARDDLPDEGAWLYAETVRAIHALNPGTGVEVLIPDFSGHPELLGQVFDAAPEVLAHNLETVPRIFKRIRPAFRYERSLDVLTQARAAGMVTKSNLILGMGETIDEVVQALHDLHAAGCDLITITQYLRPSPKHHPVERWVKPEEFVALADEATRIGFAGVDERPARALVLPRRPPAPAGARGPRRGRQRDDRHRRRRRLTRGRVAPLLADLRPASVPGDLRCRTLRERGDAHSSQGAPGSYPGSRHPRTTGAPTREQHRARVGPSRPDRPDPRDLPHDPPGRSPAAVDPPRPVRRGVRRLPAPRLPAQGHVLLGGHRLPVRPARRRPTCSAVAPRMRRTPASRASRAPPRRCSTRCARAGSSRPRWR